MVQDILEGLIVLRKHGLLTNSLILMLSVVVSRIAGLLFKIPLTNVLGGTGMGYFQSAYTVFTPIYSICAVSLPPAVSALVAENMAFKKYSNVKRIKNVALWAFALISFILTVLTMVFSKLLATRAIGNENAVYAILAISPSIFLGTVTAVYRGYFEGLKNMVPTAVSQAVEAIARVICGLGFSFLAIVRLGSINDYTLPLIAAAAVLGVTAADLAGLIYIVIRYRFCKDRIELMCANDRSDSKERYCAMKRLISLMLPMSLAALVSSLMNAVDLSTIILCIKTSLRNKPELYLEKYAKIIESGISFEELPNFLYGSFTGLALTVFSLAPSLCSVFGKSSLPIISEAYAGKDFEGLGKETKRVFAIVALISVPAGFGLSAMAKEVLEVLFASRVNETLVSALPLSIISLGTPFLAIGGAAFSMLQAVGKQSVPVTVTLIGSLVKLALNSVLVPVTSLGLAGAAISTVISYAVICIISVWVLFKEIKLSFKSLCTPLLTIGAGIVSSLTARASLRLFGNYDFFAQKALVTTVLSIANAVIIYILCIVLLDKSTKNRLIKEIFK